MGYVYGIALIVCGVLAASSVIVKKRPEAKELIAKLAQWQGWIGLVGCFWGGWGIISAILNLGMLKDFLLLWVFYLIASVLSFGVGFLLGYGMIQQFALKKANDAAKEKAEQLHKKLVSLQIPLGYICIGFGLWIVINGVVGIV